MGRPYPAAGDRLRAISPWPGLATSRGGHSTRMCGGAARQTPAAPRVPRADAAATAPLYLLLTYFSRRISGTGRPASFRASNAASTMFGLPHRYAMSPSADGAKSARNCCT